MNAAQVAMLSRMRTPLKDEFMLGEFSNAVDGESNAGRRQLVVTIAPVEGDTPQRDLALKYYLPLPQDGDSPAELGKIRAKGYGFLRATDPDFPAYPKKVSKGVYETAEGATVTWEESNAISQQIDAQVFTALEGLPSRVAGLKGTRVFIKPGKAKMDGSNQVSQFIDRLFGKLRDGETFISEELVDEATQQEFLTQLGVG